MLHLDHSPDESGIHPLHGLEHHVWRAGHLRRDRPILLLHGAWHDASCFRYMAPELARNGYDVHAVSLPGHGGSPLARRYLGWQSLGDCVRAIDHVIASFAITPLVVAHSLGASVVFKLLEVLQLPGFVALAPLPLVGVAPMLARALKSDPLPALAALFGDPTALVRDRARARRMFLSEPNPISFDADVPLGNESYRTLFELLWPRIIDVQRIRSPVLVIAAENDRVFSLDEQRRTAAAIAGAEFHVVANAAHDLMIEPAILEVVKLIDSWCERLPHARFGASSHVARNPSTASAGLNDE